MSGQPQIKYSSITKLSFKRQHEDDTGWPWVLYHLHRRIFYYKVSLDFNLLSETRKLLQWMIQTLNCSYLSLISGTKDERMWRYTFFSNIYNRGAAQWSLYALNGCQAMKRRWALSACADESPGNVHIHWLTYISFCQGYQTWLFRESTESDCEQGVVVFKTWGFCLKKSHCYLLVTKLYNERTF